MSKIVATDRGSRIRMMPEAVLVRGIRLPELPMPSSAARDILALFDKLSRPDGPVLYILN